MFRCKSVSKALAAANFEQLKPFKKRMLLLHIKLCRICGEFNAQLVSQHICEYRLQKREEEGEVFMPFSLSQSKKEAIRTTLVAAAKAMGNER